MLYIHRLKLELVIITSQIIKALKIKITIQYTFTHNMSFLPSRCYWGSVHRIVPSVDLFQAEAHGGRREPNRNDLDLS